MPNGKRMLMNEASEVQKHQKPQKGQLSVREPTERQKRNRQEVITPQSAHALGTPASTKTSLEPGFSNSAQAAFTFFVKKKFFSKFPER
jgi:hypothetical protein